MVNCSAQKSDATQCTNPKKYEYGEYFACGIKSHIKQAEVLALKKDPTASGLKVVAKVPTKTKLPEVKKLRTLQHQDTTYTILGVIGRGAYGIVEEIASDGCKYANKQQQSYQGTPGLSPTTLVEADIMSRLKHPNLVGAKDIFFQPGTNTIVNYVMAKDDKDLVCNYPKTPGTIKSFLFQLFSAVKFLHSQYVIHADLKPANILLTSGTVRVADFGLSCYDLPQSKSSEVQTYWYRSPEVFSKDRFYSIEIDIWSLGLLMRELVAGVPLCTAPEAVHLGKALTKLGVDWTLPSLSIEDIKKWLVKQQSPRSVLVPLASATRKDLLEQLTTSTRLEILKSLGTTPIASTGLDSTPIAKVLDKDWGEYARLMDACFALDPLKRISASVLLQSHLFQGMEPIPGEVDEETTSSPVLTDHSTYDLMEEILKTNQYYNKSSLILAIDLFDRVREELEWSEKELALSCLNIALKINQRCTLPLSLFVSTLKLKTYTGLDCWYLETQIVQSLKFKLYIQNLAIKCPSHSFDSVYDVFRVAHRAGDNTRDFKKLCIKINSLGQKDESSSSQRVSESS